MKDKEFKNFMKEYRKLCLKHGVIVAACGRMWPHVAACGCCRSPWLAKVNDEEEIKDHLDHLKNES